VSPPALSEAEGSYGDEVMVLRTASVPLAQIAKSERDACGPQEADFVPSAQLPSYGKAFAYRNSAAIPTGAERSEV